MAQKVITTLIDDLDGGEAHESLTFGLDGKSYEIDLSEVNADKLRELLAPFVKVGRRKSSAGTLPKQVTRGANKTVSSALGVDPQEARAWAKENGFEVSDRGRVPRPILEAFAKATA
jgi:hypothetical protein